MRLIVLSGSGLSAESGIATFRGAGGWHEGMRAEDFLSAAHYRRAPEAIERWHATMRAAVSNAQPNAAHRALAAHQARSPETLVFTQNVDTLLEAAGASRVVHLHGQLDQVRCLGHAHVAPVPAAPEWYRTERCARCRSRLRSDVILFGERAPAYASLWAALSRAREDDALLVVGTQGVVLDINTMAAQFPGHRMLCNLHPSPHIDAARFHAVEMRPATEGVPALLAQIETRIGEA